MGLVRGTSRFLGFVAVVITLWWAAPAPAHACSCIAMTEPEALESADAAFTGELVGIERVGDAATYEFEVDAVFKGDVATRQDIHTEGFGGACGLELSDRESYLMFADREDDGALSSSLCSGTRPTTADDPPAGFPGAEEPAPAAPEEQAASVSDDPGDSFPWVWPVAVAAAAAATGIVVWLVRHRPA